MSPDVSIKLSSPIYFYITHPTRRVKMYLLKVNGRPTGLSATALSRANFLQSPPDCIKQHDNERGGEEFKVYQFAAHCNFSLYTVRRKSTYIIIKSLRYGTSFRGAYVFIYVFCHFTLSSIFPHL